MPLPPLQILNSRPPMVSGVLLGFDIILNINEQTGTTVTLFQLSGWAQASGDPGGYGFLRVIGAQSLEPGEPLLIRRSCRTIFSPLNFIPFPLQLGKQVLYVRGCRDEVVNGGFQLRLIAGSRLYGRMLDIALALILTGDDDGQTMLFADAVAGTAYFVIAAFVGM